ncbi:MAG: hypothetical protein J5496_09390 [Lachnospiraceae bacterium]|nr:hypothetical protein [Lachnospiraceae bacterium]
MNGMHRKTKGNRHGCLLLMLPVFLCFLFWSGGAAAAAADSLPISGPEVLFRYGRTQLEGAALYAYDLLTEQLICEDPADTLYPEPGIIDKESMKKAMQVFLADYPECFWLTGGYEGALSGDYYFEIYLKTRWQGGTLMMMRQAVEQQTEKILEGISGENGWELALAIHDRLTEYLRYEESDKDQTVYGALVEKRCVCTGYARAYQYLLNRVGIPAFTVDGNADNGQVSEPERHAWSLFWPEDGICVYADVTWDDHGDEPWHRCFALSAAQIGRDHFPNPDLVPLPVCGHEGLDYYHQGRGFLLTPDTTPGEAATFCQLIGEDRYRLDLFCEGTDYESWAAGGAIRALMAELGYQNAATCAYQISTRTSGAEYRVTLQVIGGIRLSPAETLTTENMPPTEALTEAPAETEKETLAETVEEESTAPAKETSEEPDVIATFPAETAGTAQEQSGEGSLLSALLTFVKGAGLVLAALTALILGLIVLTRIGKKK